MLQDSKTSYGTITKTFHWLMALLVISLLCVGFWMTTMMEPSPDMFVLYKWHKQIGIIVLILAAARIVWRLTNTIPDILGPSKKWEIGLARAVHVIFFISFLTMPLAGWFMSSAKGFSVSFFGYTLPNFIGEDKAVADFLGAFHYYNACVLVGAIALHFGGVLKHVFVYKDGTLRRMLPKFIFVGAVLFSFSAQASNWVLEKATSKITFEGTQMGAGFLGEFKNFDAKIFFDPAALDKTDITVEIDLSSVSSKSSERDTTVLNEEWFDVKTYPKAIFKSTSVKLVEGDNYEAVGTLSLRGVTKEVTLPFTYKEVLSKNTEEHSKVALVTSKGFTLNRIDYGVGAKNWADPEAVGITFPVGFELNAHSVPLSETSETSKQ